MRHLSLLVRSVKLLHQLLAAMYFLFLAGLKAFDDKVILKIGIEEGMKSLTDREKEIVDLLDGGYTRKQVAEALSTDKRNIGVHSVGLYIKKIRRKMKPYIY